MPSGVATLVYRVVQEALTNVARHAEASTASVAVTVASGRLRAVVEDDGMGFDRTARATEWIAGTFHYDGMS